MSSFKVFIKREYSKIYREVQQEVQQEYDKIIRLKNKKSGKTRSKKENIIVQISCKISNETDMLITDYKNKYNIQSRNEAIEELIIAGYIHKSKCSE